MSARIGATGPANRSSRIATGHGRAHSETVQTAQEPCSPFS